MDQARETIPYEAVTLKHERWSVWRFFLLWACAAWVSGMLVGCIAVFPMYQPGPFVGRGLVCIIYGMVFAFVSGVAAVVLMVSLALRQLWLRGTLVVSPARTVIAGAVYALLALVPGVVDVALQPRVFGNWPAPKWSVPLSLTCLVAGPVAAAFWVAKEPDWLPAP